jgi:hypothetical protein
METREGARNMEQKIQWETAMNPAINRSKAEKKPILLDFFNPG